MRPVILLFICALLIEATCNTDAPYHEKIKDETYGPDARNKMDVFLPARRDSSTEVVILIHGGAWVAGDKSDFSGSEFTYHLLQSGLAVASINYRYACGDFHKQMEDVGLAIRHIHLKAEGWNIGGSRFALLGGSAGGHLALLYAHAFDTLQMVKAAVSLAGPTDLTDTLFHRYAANYKIEYVFEQLMGTALQQNPQLYHEASPVFYSANVPSLLIHGKLDDLVPSDHSVRMNDSLQAAGIASKALIFNNAGHNVFGDGGENGEEILNAVSDWMLLYLDEK